MVTFQKLPLVLFVITLAYKLSKVYLHLHGVMTPDMLISDLLSVLTTIAQIAAYLSSQKITQYLKGRSFPRLKRYASALSTGLSRTLNRIKQLLR